MYDSDSEETPGDLELPRTSDYIVVLHVLKGTISEDSRVI